MLKRSPARCNGAEKIDQEVSNQYVADEIAGVSRGLEIMIDDDHWERYRAMPADEFAAYLIGLAKQIKLSAFKRHPRGSKKPRAERTKKTGENHVSTKKILNKRLRSK